jgi:hypothetical protein
MTIVEFHESWKQRLDKGDTQSYPDFLPEQIDLALNEAQDIFIKTRYGRNNIYQQGFEEIQKRTDDLNTLVKTVEITANAVDTEPKKYKVNLQGTLPDTNKYMFFLRASVQTSTDKCANTYRNVTLVRHDQLDRILKDPFNKSTFDNPVICFEDGGIMIYADSTFNVSKLKLTYIKRPVALDIYNNVTSELPEHTHTEIIDIAVERMLEVIESARLSTKVAVDQKTE